MFPHLWVLPPVKQEISDPSTWRVGCAQQGAVVLLQSGGDGDEC